MKLSLSVLTIVFIFLFAIYIYQGNLIYFPGKRAPTAEETRVPELQTIALHTDDGLTLTAWYSPPSLPNMPTLVYLHGNSGHIGHRSKSINFYLNNGFGVLFLAYRGFSGNPGTPSEKGLYEDARAAIRFLFTKSVPNSCLVLLGESLGTAVAIQMATEYNVGALILQSPFTSLSDVGKYIYPHLPIKWLLQDKYESFTKIHRIHCPVLVILAGNDKTIPLQISQKLYDAITAPKKLIISPNKEHNALNESGAIVQFMHENVHCM
ncbi:MAG: alpha/beta hydrolase [Parachlamydiaceae bacterium]|nr:alpha/beta hydrolase [Parachlamydiaceae bacterium]